MSRFLKAGQWLCISQDGIDADAIGTVCSALSSASVDLAEQTVEAVELSGASVPSDLEGGKQLTVELRVSQGKIELGNVSISGWENQGTIGGEIIM